MQQMISELTEGLHQLAEKRTDGSWHYAYYLKQPWGHCLIYNVLHIEPFLDFFKERGGVAFHFLTDAEQFSSTNARVFFKFGATTLVPPGHDDLTNNPTAKVLSYDSPDFFKSNLKYHCYDEVDSKAIISLTGSGQRFIFLNDSFVGKANGVQHAQKNGRLSTNALRELTASLKDCDYIVTSTGSSPKTGLYPSPKDPIDILE